MSFFLRYRFRWHFRLCVGCEFFLVLAEAAHGVAELRVERGAVAAEGFEAVDVVAYGGDTAVLLLFVSEGVRWGGEGSPALDELEVGILAATGMEGVDGLFVDGHLGVDEGGFESGEAGLTPGDGGELVDEGVFHISLGVEGGADAVEVELEVLGIFDVEDVVDGGGKSMFEGITGGFGFAFGGGGAMGFGSVDAGLFGFRVCVFH